MLSAFKFIIKAGVETIVLQFLLKINKICKNIFFGIAVKVGEWQMIFTVYPSKFW